MLENGLFSKKSCCETVARSLDFMNSIYMIVASLGVGVLVDAVAVDFARAYCCKGLCDTRNINGDVNSVNYVLHNIVIVSYKICMVNILI